MVTLTIATVKLFCLQKQAAHGIVARMPAETLRSTAAASHVIFPSVHAVHDQVLDFIDEPGSKTFEALALTVFAHHFDAVAPYRLFCRGRNRTPDNVTRWSDIPAVPIQAFKQADLCCGPAERTFLSTGTTAGPERRSRHLMPDVRLYRRSAVAGLRTFLLPDVERIRIISLIPPVAVQPESSLAQMVHWAMETFGDEGSRYAADPSGMRFDALVESLRDAERSGYPCCLMTTTGALIGLLDHVRQHGLTFRLPHGSRLMDTGGAKGAPRHLSRNGLLHACWNTFAIPGYFCVNEYGMAELSSQFYDNVIARRVAGRFGSRYKVGPHWTRTIVLDPESLLPAAPGTHGLLCHFDLANAGSALAVLSEDVGYQVDDGFEIVGRAVGAEARGCSLSLSAWRETAVAGGLEG